MAPPPRYLCVVLHDVAPATWPACERVIAAIDEIAALPLTLLVVPRYWNTLPHPGFEHKLDGRLVRGDELALHGYTHRDELPVSGVFDWLRRRVYTAGEGEFAALSASQAQARLDAGRRWFSDRGWPLHGFVAPAWLLSPGSWQALRRSDFLYTGTLDRLHLLPPPAASMFSRSQVFSTRSAWRRRLSIVWNRLLAWRQREAPLIRLELHPWDADHPAVKRSWQTLLKEWLETRTPMTTADFLREYARCADDGTAVASVRRLDEPEGENAAGHEAEDDGGEHVARIMQAEDDAR